jgi:hypothetical protein
MRPHNEKVQVLSIALRLLDIEIHDAILDKIIKITDLMNERDDIYIDDIKKLKNDK